ncbi:MAG: DNA-binding response regulator [Bacteroidetes bacterium 4572_77]|nr:MAG: DNA-binding response regulator [Bacteroidetes bacterium 4572_77]
MDNSNYKILLVDDEEDILEFLSYNLRKEGYLVYTASNGKEGLEKAVEVVPDLIVLDVMMPVMDGIESCEQMRSVSDLQTSIIIFLTARSEDYSQIAGLNVGADDYIAKPIKPKVFLSKVQSLLRRKQRHNQNTPEESGQVLQINDSFVIDKERYVVRLNKQEISLPRKEFELLLLFTSKVNKVFTREEIFAEIWGSQVVVGDRTIDVHIRKIREKIGNDYIATVKGVGYKFVNPVKKA